MSDLELRQVQRQAQEGDLRAQERALVLHLRSTVHLAPCSVCSGSGALRRLYEGETFEGRCCCQGQPVPLTLKESLVTLALLGHGPAGRLNGVREITLLGKGEGLHGLVNSLDPSIKLSVPYRKVLRALRQNCYSCKGRGRWPCPTCNGSGKKYGRGRAKKGCDVGAATSP